MQKRETDLKRGLKGVQKYFRINLVLNNNQDTYNQGVGQSSEEHRTSNRHYFFSLHCAQCWISVLLPPNAFPLHSAQELWLSYSAGENTMVSENQQSSHLYMWMCVRRRNRTWWTMMSNDGLGQTKDVDYVVGTMCEHACTWRKAILSLEVFTCIRRYELHNKSLSII